MTFGCPYLIVSHFPAL